MATQTVEAVDHKLLAAGEWIETGEWGEVKSPYDGSPVRRGALGGAAHGARAARAGAGRPARSPGSGAGSPRRTRPSSPPTSLSTSAPPPSTGPPSWSANG